MIVLPSNSCTLTPDAIGPGLLTAEYSGDTGFAASSASVMHRVVGIAEQSTFTLIRNGSGAGNVTSYDGMIDCGATCSHLYANGTELILYATPEPGSIFTGWLGACTGQVDCLAAVPSPVTVSATFALDASVPFNGDIDRDGSYSALTDGLIAMRYLFGLSGEAMVAGTLGADATRTDPAAVSAFLSDIRPRLDVDGNGSADALTDGVMLIRYLFGLRGAALINGAMGTGATRTTAAQIEAALQSLLP
jgi:hypothetical protein